MRFLPPDSSSQRKLREKNINLRKKVTKRYTKVFTSVGKDVSSAASDVDKSRSMTDDACRDIRAINSDLLILAQTLQNTFPSGPTTFFPSLRVPPKAERDAAAAASSAGPSTTPEFPPPVTIFP